MYIIDKTKKVFVFVFVLLVIFNLSGCVDEKDASSIFSKSENTSTNPQVENNELEDMLNKYLGDMSEIELPDVPLD